MNFTEMQIPTPLRTELLARGYTTATPVQEAIVSPDYATGDLLVSSKTGSGKTIAFGLAIAPQLLGSGDKLLPTKTPRALVVAPTRELAQQVAEELYWLYRASDVRMATCVGGMDIRREQKQLYAGPHIVVGTPGRLNDHIKRGSLKLEGVEAVILDEADEMLDMGFREELEFILDAAKDRTRTLLFSATIPTEIERMAQRYTKDAKRIASAAGEAHGDIEYLAHRVSPREREAAVVNVLRYYDAKSALVFVATRDSVNDLAERLFSRGFSTVALSGELSQSNRDRAIQMMKSGHARVLVATDVAARGLDLPDVGVVIHADPPNDPSVLQHRSGRTGRAGQKGVAVILVPIGRERYVERQLQTANITAELMPIPLAQDIEPLDAERFISSVTELLANTTAQQQKTAAALLEKYSAQDLVAAFVRREQSSLPAIEELPTTRRMVSGVSSTPLRRDAGPSRGATTSDDYVWFKVNIGRTQQADPKWLIPLVCRRGNVQKADIGQINISARYTEFEIKKRLASEFDRAAQQPDSKDPKVRFERRDAVRSEPVLAPARVIKAAAKPEAIAEVELPVKKVEPLVKSEITIEAKPPVLKLAKPLEDAAPAKPEPLAEVKVAKAESVKAEPVKVVKAEVKPAKPAPDIKAETKPAAKVAKAQPTKAEPAKVKAKPPEAAKVEAKAAEAPPKKTKAPKADEAEATPAKPVRSIKANPWIEKFKQEAQLKKQGFAPPKRTKKK